MNRDAIRIRVAALDDAEDLLAIYAPYVQNTAVTFEYDVPRLEDFQSRMETTLKQYPYIVAEKGGEILGYAYSGAFVGRAAYGWAAEVTVYVKETKRGNGIGGKLYAALEGLSKAQHILNLNACIAYPETPDAYLTDNSMQFHRHLGYRMVGKFHQCGYKFGRWYHMVWMEKMLGEHPADPPAVIGFPDLKPSVFQSLGIQLPR